jgi:5-oxoprolinase (ATP-hydrolysing) subunit A
MIKVRVLLNIDLGELDDEPEDLYPCAHIANVACGGHAGDETSMRRAVDLCRVHAVRLGAHPSFPDRDGFGRRRVAMTSEALRRSVADQCARLEEIAHDGRERIEFVKPHGALYHAARDDAALAEAVVGGARQALGARCTLIGPPEGALAEAASRARLGYAREGFADRAVRANGRLVPRDEPGALLLDPTAAALRACELAASGDVETLCVHGDTPGAVVIARAVRAAIDALAARVP